MGIWLKILWLAAAGLVLSFAAPPVAQAAFEDDEACLMCHKYPRMGRVTQEGVFRSYNVPPDKFSKTVHRNVPCRDCHNYIKELPHRPVEVGVECNQQCHSKNNPATGKPFSHQPVYDIYKNSVHAREKVAEGLDADKPYCITCHTNPLYNPHQTEPPKKIVDRCELCHEKLDFVTQWYSHTSRRVLEVKRTGKEIVELCSRCHSNEKLLERHAAAAEESGEPLGEKFLIAAESYEESFHGKVTKYGLEGAATCLDCHADQKNYYRGLHGILPSRDPAAPTNEKNRVNTCRKCHKDADEKFLSVDPHPSFDEKYNPVLHKAEAIYGIVGNAVVAALIGLSLFETFGRRRDGVAWRVRWGSTWWRRSRRNRKRIIPRK
jgi:hypothetical protein